MEGLKINVTTDNNQIIVRTGEAQKAPVSRSLSISGTISTVRKFVEKRFDEINDMCKSVHILVILTSGRIVLVMDEKSDRCTGVDEIIGSIETSNELKKWCINSGKGVSPYDLARVIRMNRHEFLSKDVAFSLASKLQKFEATVNEQIKKENDNKGNVTALKSQVVKSNLPDGFELKIAVFSGHEKMIIPVEIDIDPNTLDCQLVSAELNQIDKEMRETIIDLEIKAIEALIPDVPMMYV